MRAALYDSVAALRLVDGAIREFSDEEPRETDSAESLGQEGQGPALHAAAPGDDLRALLETIRRRRADA
jgi:hypothetical protein